MNVGATAAIKKFDDFDYPVCTVCGQSISPLSSERQWEHFQEDHLKRCGRKPDGVGFYADVVADTLSLPACADAKTAYSVLEAVRIGAAQVLDMHVEDLQVLVIGHVDRDEVDGLLWDPMPGGSGLIDQICERFKEVVAASLDVVGHCPAECDTSCIDCLQTFRNAFYHKHLERKLAGEHIATWGPRLEIAHDIPPEQPSQEQGGSNRPVNEAERRLRHLLRAAGFEEGIRGEQLRLDPAIGTTTPDVIYRAAHHAADEGVCIYLDGLSDHIHGNAQTADRDKTIRNWLRNSGWDVIEIAASDLHDDGAMSRHFRRLTGYLRADDVRTRIQADTSWFDRADPESSILPFKPKIVSAALADRYRTCVPLLPLKVAAGWFSEQQHAGEPDDWQWVAVDARHRLRVGMFVAQVTGRSMEPAIPDGSYCLFRSPVEGSRHGKTVLVQLRDVVDPEHCGRYTLKRYESQKAVDGDTWRHVKITQKPSNSEFKTIELTAEDEASVAVVAELVEVLG